MAALSMDRKGLEPLRLALCMLPAITSLPVPLSPVIKNRLIGPGKTTGAFQQFLKQEPPAVEIIKGMFGLSRFGRVGISRMNSSFFWMSVIVLNVPTAPITLPLSKTGLQFPTMSSPCTVMGMGFLGFPSFQHGLERILGEDYRPIFCR